MNQAVGITLTDLEESALVRVCDADTASYVGGCEKVRINGAHRS